MEEMRRVQRYFVWKSKWWRGLSKESGSCDVSRGKSAYATKQAASLLKLREKFISIWHSELRGLHLDINIINT